MTFPLFQRPGTVAILDDDPEYLEMLAMVLPAEWHVRLFLRPAEFVAHLERESPFWEADAWHQQQLIEQWHAGKPLVPQVLGYWSRSTERYALTRVCVVDYSMPGMDGLQTLAALADWQGSRVLLTGQADEQVAVRAFNQGLIDQFIAKQSPDISGRLIGAVEALLGTPHPRHAQTWRVTLTQEQNALLRQPAVARDLVRWLQERRWVEHVTIGDPFGVLGMDARGSVGWLQLEPEASLGAAAELAAVEGAQAAEVDAVREGRQLANLELRQSLGGALPVQFAPAFAIGGNALRGALFMLPPALAPDPDNAYGHWLGRQAQRAVG